jgi:mannose-6-phosphate isomerase-like protein (cupin superfamily)
MIVRSVQDHQRSLSPWCGEIREILATAEYPAISVAEAIDIKTTRAHFHRTFDEIYFVLDGSIRVRLYDPATSRTWEQLLAANELCVISKGLHHGIVEASEQNRLCAICLPRFNPADETTSDRI